MKRNKNKRPVSGEADEASQRGPWIRDATVGTVIAAIQQGKMNPEELRRTFEKLPGPRAHLLRCAITDLVKLQRQRFTEKFGREPGPYDPLFFDPDKDVPTLREADARQLGEDARRVGIPADKAYAIGKTGRVIIADVNEHLFSAEEKAEWQAAIEEFRRLQ